ncbi:VRR-NUC domain-containing protein [Pseudomonas sp. M47T1]|uniref:VRR-NUC domain-containing protein n=1 Tax=Pseudomonas sp. M47T1 TaxID=1179778 RepID=UPI000260844A|nr:VRR-NUC domain-containing protein [Pseudomonas sp. M47T1]EIK93114.1 VRR-NUC domain-containing protein [Pseudomonas sp. M47T1]
MAVLQQPQTSQGCTTTSIEGTVERAPLPSPRNLPYLMEKASYAARFPKIAIRCTREGTPSEIQLKQIVMSGLIRADEYRYDYFWDYKAEVSFDMSYTPPQPFLSSSLLKSDVDADPDRRHTLTPFPKGSTGGLLRRPDVIIVKNRSIRWPGRAGTDHQGLSQPDNLERVVEIKFPGDELSRDQAQDYIIIAGSPTRFSVLSISDCRTDDDKERDHEYNRNFKPTAAYDSKQWHPLGPVTSPEMPPMPAPTPVPVYGPEPTARPAQVESWTQLVQREVAGVIEQGAEGVRYLSAEIQNHLESSKKWLTENGSWARDEIQGNWTWITEEGVQITQWTDEQLKAAWKEIQRYTDLTTDMLKEVNWTQVMMDPGTKYALAIVVISIGAVVVGATLVTVGIPATLLAPLIVILRIAQVFWALLAGVLGSTAATSAAIAG